ncbi:hypothetical protein KD146_16000 [Devosia sp. BSSL-BM10]|uniref:Uncharacterized protein n=1 Tax=Devosia litorisediminis TaxID=2829817 RepID=A0A942E8T4_9HYPH|nr:hypothetical protein [Devosia litorisediminis]MBS3850203.1 hypothetical protein [Devosia litorisediminis]
MTRKQDTEKKPIKFSPQNRKNRPTPPLPMVDPADNPMAPGIMHPEYKRDLRLLDRVLPEPISQTVRKKLPTALRTVAIAYGVDTSSTHWIAETLFHLAIENPILGITERNRGYQHGHPFEVADDRNWLRFVFREKAAVELDLRKTISIRELAAKITILENLAGGKKFNEIDTTSQEFADNRRRIYERILGLRKAYPDIARIPF